MGDQRRGGRFAVGAGDGDKRAIRGVNATLAHEQLDIADDLDTGGMGEINGPMRLRMCQRNPRRQDEGGEIRPVRLMEIAGSDPCGSRLGNAVGIVVPGRDQRATGNQRLRSRKP